MENHFKEVMRLQERILFEFSKNNAFGQSGLYLSGGTALARFHREGTRFSEDLDFFFEKSTEDWKGWMATLSLSGFTVEVMGTSRREGFAMTATALISSENLTVKVDWIEDFFWGMWFPRMYALHDFNIWIDHVDAIRHKKLFSIEQAIKRGNSPRNKDVFDLLEIVRGDWEGIHSFYDERKEIAGFDLDLIRSTLLRHRDFSGIFSLDGRPIEENAAILKKIESWK